MLCPSHEPVIAAPLARSRLPKNRRGSVPVRILWNLGWPQPFYHRVDDLPSTSLQRHNNRKPGTLSKRSKNKPKTGRQKSSEKIFVVGCDASSAALIAELPGAQGKEIVWALAREDVQPPSGHIDFDELYERARNIIEAHGGEPAAIIGDLDFPVTSLLSLLNRDYDLPGASPEAVARCEHKYWLRMEQKKAFPEQAPEVCAINPFNVDEARKQAPANPFWLKPVKCHSSVLGFMIYDEQGLDKALHACRNKIHYFGEPFNRFLRHVDTSVINGIDGNYAVAEEIISEPVQFTVEGYAHNGEFVVYGVVLSRRTGRQGTSLASYQYPAELPTEIVERATEITKKVLVQVAYDAHPFNAEFFWNPDSGALNLLEINPRISKSHAPLFRTQNRSPAIPRKYASPPVAPYNATLPTTMCSSGVIGASSGGFTMILPPDKPLPQ